MNITSISLALTMLSFIAFFFGFRDLSFKSSENKNKVSGIAFIGIAIALVITAILISKIA